MSDKCYLVYFLFSIKDELGFDDAIDFRNKIKSDFDFRFKIQKFVFLSKYFGWNNHYKYALYSRGPYSSDLSDDYYYQNIFEYTPLKIDNFKLSSFKEFIMDKSQYYLEATSTILFYKSFTRSFLLDDAISTLREIKPHISLKIIKEAYGDVLNFNLTGNPVLEDVCDEWLFDFKKNLQNRIIKLISIFYKFDLNENSHFILTSLNYLKTVLRNETLSNNVKRDLLELISGYVREIEKLYSLSDGKENIFIQMDLNSLVEFFDRLYNYITNELDISIKQDSFYNSNVEYIEIKKHILNKIIPKYDELFSCELSFEDEVGNPAFEYYVRYEGELSLERKEYLNHEIFAEVYHFCVCMNFPDIFKTISIFLVKEQVF